jgi:predicted thioesterase
MTDGDHDGGVQGGGVREAVSVSTLGPLERVARSARVTLAPGIERSDEFVVADRLLTDVGGSIGVAVLSTPGMIAMIERNAALLAFEHLPEGRATVGFEVCVRHVAASLEGARCRAHARLDEVLDGRKLRFTVEVRELAGPGGEASGPGGQASGGGSDEQPGRTIGLGTHERRVIDVAAHATAAGS